MAGEQAQPKIQPVYKLQLEPGTFRDYTTYSAEGCTASQWIRFYHGRIKKIGGYEWIGGVYSSYSVENSLLVPVNLYGDSFTNQSYPAIQYINQLPQPYEYTDTTADSSVPPGTPYILFNSNNNQSTAYASTNYTINGFGVPRRVININLNNANAIISAGDAYSIDEKGNTLVSGMAFSGNLINKTQLQEFTPMELNYPGILSKYKFYPNEYVWSLTAVQLTTGIALTSQSTILVAHASCGQTKSIEDETNYYVYTRNLFNLLGEIPDNTPFSPTGMVPLTQGFDIPGLPADYIATDEVMVSGGVCAVGPFLFAYGNNGLIRNSDQNNPYKWFNLNNESFNENPGLANDVNIGGTKIVKCLPVKGTDISYAALFWSLDSLILAVYVGAPNVFNYSIVSSNTTIIAANSAIEDNGVFYWVGDGRFLTYNGGPVTEIPNMNNQNYFFDNLNKSRQHIIWASKIPRYKEIWWFYPSKNSYECDSAIIYNYETNSWYDTKINRGAGFYNPIVGYPTWVDNRLDVENATYNFYNHEQGMNYTKKDRTQVPIQCSFTTPDIGFTSSMFIGSMGKMPYNLRQNWLLLLRVEPDAIMTGEWTFQTLSRRFAQSPVMYGEEKVFKQDTPVIDIEEQGRIMQLKISSTSLDSSIYLGDLLITGDAGDSEGF